MKMERFKLTQLVFFTLLIGVFTWLIFWLSGDKLEENKFEHKSPPKTELIEDRQLIRINLDSLESLYRKDDGVVFNYNRNRNSISFEALERNERQFLMYFLNGNTSLLSMTNLGFKFKENPYLLEFKIENKNESKFVSMPAEIVQNILINK